MTRTLSLLGVVLFTVTGCCNPFRSTKLDIDRDRLSEATVGKPYEVDIHFTNADTPIGEVTLAAGVLPPGLRFEANRAAMKFSIRGTPLKAGTFEFSVNAYSYGTMCPGKYFDRAFRLTVLP